MSKSLLEKAQALLSDMDPAFLLDNPSEESIFRESGLRGQLEFKESCGMGLVAEDYPVFGIDCYSIQSFLQTERLR